LIARVDAVYRRVEVSKGRTRGSGNKERILSGEFSLNIRNRSLGKKGAQIDLTQVEFQILEYFFLNPGAALSRTAILNHVWGTDYAGEEKIVDVNIRRIRMKVESDPSSPAHLITIWGIGYKWIS
jgi:DNA-binding response OmpR family regulator